MQIYKLTNSVNGKVYIGQTIRRLITRLNQHKKADSAIGNAIRKYGLDNFTIEIVATAQSLDELNRLEQDMIANLNTRYPNGYNITPGGDNHQWTEELKARFSESRKGEGNPRFGVRRPMLDSTKQKLREIRTGSVNKACQVPIICLDTNVKYESLSAAAKALNLRSPKISLVCSGKRRSTGGLRFAYIKEVNE